MVDETIKDNAAALKEATREINAITKEIAEIVGIDSNPRVRELAAKLNVHTTHLNVAVSNALNPPPPTVENTGGAATPINEMST